MSIKPAMSSGLICTGYLPVVCRSSSIQASSALVTFAQVFKILSLPNYWFYHIASPNFRIILWIITKINNEIVIWTPRFIILKLRKIYKIFIT